MNNQMFFRGFVISLAAMMLLALTATSAFGQALFSNPLTSNQEDAPGLVYYDSRQTGLDFEIGFKVDSEKLYASSFNDYGCGGWTPWGMWLFDRHPSYEATGRWMITMSRDGNLCFKDMPDQGATTLEFENIPFDRCLVLTATHTGGVLAVSVNGQVQRVATGIQNPTYRGGPNGIGVGREVNGYHNRWSNQSFAGEIFHVRDGTIYPLETGVVTGNARIGASTCGGTTTPASACETDPDGVACQCELDPHPACNMCLIE